MGTMFGFGLCCFGLGVCVCVCGAWDTMFGMLKGFWKQMVMMVIQGEYEFTR
jgi:hypothetical protein